MRRQEFLKNSMLLLKEKEHIEDLNNKAVADIEGFITECEEKYHKQVDDLVEDILSYGNKRIILLAGPTSSGKTTTSKIITKKLKEVGITCMPISLDNFLVPLNERKILSDGALDYDSFATIDVKAFNNFLRSLAKNNHANMPIYNFVKNRPEDEKQEVVIEDNTILIVEGLHALNPNLIKDEEVKKTAYKIYISPNVDFYFKNKLVLNAIDLRLMRRSIRDYHKRGSGISDTLKTWKHTITSENLYIKPYKKDVDFIINSTHNYEIMLYAKYLKPILDATEIDDKEVYDMMRTLDACEQINKILVPEDSMLWEFLYL